MNILYVGTERAEAQAIAAAVSGLGAGVRVSWAAHLGQATKWIDEAPGPRALVVEARPAGPVWRSVLTQAAALPHAVPIVIIVPEGTPSHLQPVGLNAHEFVARSGSLVPDLPGAITRAIEKVVEVERAMRLGVEQKLAQASAAVQQAERRHETAMAAAAEQRARSEAQHEIGLARAAAARDMVDEQFREAAIEVERARRNHASVVASAERLAQRAAELSALLDAATASEGVLERRLAEAESALRDGEARASTEQRRATELLTERQREFQTTISEETDRRRGVEGMLAHALSAGDAAEQRHALAIAAATAQSLELQAALSAARQTLESRTADLAALASREATLEEQLREGRASRTALEQELADAGAALDDVRCEHQSAAADVARLTGREAVLASELADASAAWREERQRHDAALATAAGRLAERQAYFDRERTDLTAQLRAVEAARDQARSEQQSAVANLTRLTRRQTELEGRLKEELATRDDLEQAVAHAAVALQEEQQRHRAALAMAAGELADRLAHFDHERAEAEAARGDLAARLRVVEEAHNRARSDHQSAAADVARLAGREVELTSALADAQAGQRTLEIRLTEAERAGSDAAERAAGDRAAATARQADLEVRLSQANATIESLQQTLAEAHASARVTERRFKEEIDALRAAALVQATQSDDRFDEQRRQYESRLADAQNINETLTREHTLALATRDDEMERLRTALKARLDELEVTKRQRESLQAHADQLPALRQELEQRRADNHRLFQQATLPMFRCTRDGALTQANRMLTILVGGRSPDELRGAEFAASVFESPDDLSWLIERCLGSKGKESTETTWRRKDGSRLLVRLSACATSSDLIECGVEDLTPVRVLQDRLSQAHRMEAVGRLAAEVAVTCGNLLRGVQQNAAQWMMTNGSDTASRQHGEMLLEEMSRAAGLLTQLAAYGDQESRSPAVVELGAVVRGIAPVLKRVAGDAVKVQLPAASAPLNVDAGAERVERLLVNLAAYGRERMTCGGQLKIELGTSVVDRHFTDKHPNVRLGPHALVTVTESRRTTQTDRLLSRPDIEAGPGSRATVVVPTSVDLGTLQELVGECGGHLWMTVQPPGDMVVKIRLPLRTSYGEPPQRTLVPDRVRAIANWFQH